MHEFWDTVSYYKHCIKFKINKKNYSFDLETFKRYLQFVLNPSWQELKLSHLKKISAFIRELGYPRDIKLLYDVKYCAILPDTLTNEAMKELDVYKTYHNFATGKVIPKPKYVWRLTREKTDQAPTTSPGKTLKAIAKVAKSGKKKLHAQGLETLSEITLSEAEQMKEASPMI
ncbi:hypothetical protein Tco_0779184 [Tanacetum coccineum]